MRVLGLAVTGHGTSACLVEDGRVVGAVNLERLTRVKFSPAALPGEAEGLEGIVRNVFGNHDPPKFFDFYEWFPELLWQLTGEREIAKADIDLVVKTHDNIRPGPLSPDSYGEFLKYFGGTRTHFDLEHHLCHAYQAYLTSPFESAAVLTIDGTGEHLERLGNRSITTSLCVGEGQRIRVLAEVQTLSSVGGLYSTFTSHLGFQHEQEGNTMALASFGTDRFYRAARTESIQLLDGGLFFLSYSPDLKGLRYADHMRAFAPPRERGAPITDVHEDLAWGAQAFAEEIIEHVARGLHARTKSPRLAMAGGVALNCVANAKILRETPFEEMHVTPNAGDRGLSLGAALFGYHVVLGGKERHPPRHDYLGRPFAVSEIDAALQQVPSVESRHCPDIALECARLIAQGRIIGWVQGGAEFGPRALGHRSILADPRTTRSKERLDAEIKRREWFRPYAPSVLAERASEYFEMPDRSPYMLLAVATRPEVRDRIAGVVHVDGSARVQTVERDVEPLYYRLISCFDEITGVAMVLNTSFNGYGEPMVESPREALEALHAMHLDAVAIGDVLAWRAGTPP